MQKHYYLYNNIKICHFGVIDHYVFFKKNKNTAKYKIQIIKNVKQVFNDLLQKNDYLYTFSIDNKKLNKWHTFIGMKLQEQFIYKNKKYNVWVA